MSDGHTRSGYVIPRSTGRLNGKALLMDRRYFKGTGFTLEERHFLGIEGLLPPGVFTQEEQCERFLARLRSRNTDLDGYRMLVGLQGRNQKLFYYVVQNNVYEVMPLIYTPTVGLACQKFGSMGIINRGLYISMQHKGRVRQVLQNWESDKVRAIVFTDGQRILGLGDLGAYGMGIPLGKLALYTALGGINPHHTLPVTLDVGTNTESLLNDPMYTGLRAPRATGEAYDELVDEFITAATAEFGRDVLLQFEDFGNENAFRLLRKYENKVCTFNDDIQGTAAVVAAGVLAALPQTGKGWAEHRFLFLGAGSAGLGIAELIAQAHAKAVGCSVEEARGKIWCVDSRGLVFKGRASGGINSDKEPFAHEWSEAGTLGASKQALEVYVKALGITGLFGVSTLGGAFTPEVIKAVHANSKKPIIFALSNPTSKAECTAEAAYTHTDGAALFASGSPFEPVTLASGEKRVPGQGNNSYIFPGIALGVLAVRSSLIPNQLFLTAAETLAAMVTDEEIKFGTLYPPLANIRKVSAAIAAAVAAELYDLGLAKVQPRPDDLEAYCVAQMWDCTYDIYCPPDESVPSSSRSSINL